jgi:hypothetical protein
MIAKVINPAQQHPPATSHHWERVPKARYMMPPFLADRCTDQITNTETVTTTVRPVFFGEAIVWRRSRLRDQAKWQSARRMSAPR